MGGMYR